MAKQKTPEVAEVLLGEEVTIEAASGLVVLPDGHVVTCRQSYKVQVEGEHSILSSDAETVLVTFIGVTEEAESNG